MPQLLTGRLASNQIKYINKKEVDQATLSVVIFCYPGSPGWKLFFFALP
ncbi:hypothetical protein H206_06949 [Candidatus Electrothrix aarhusensis]|uniref:Uncharacterized protein n=1 Tax=Candidatus Electrothrix aarhusensis TaxID=1859131 RepID=A0A3S3QU02_9BACT|nr:hypothetical protein H206_06949 [Candidatus Electrothrix aarhusensis]